MKLKKMLAPILISLFFILVWGGLLIMIWMEPLDLISKVFMTIPFIGAMGCMIYVLHQRIQEIKGGNEDDLSNY